MIISEYNDDFIPSLAEQEANERAIRHALLVWHESRGKTFEPVLDLFAEEVDFWSVAAGRPAIALGFTGTRTTKAEVADYLQQIMHGWRMNHHYLRVLTARGNEIQTIADVDMTAKRSGKSIRTLVFVYYRFRAGKVIAYREMFDSAGALAAMTPG